MKTQGRVPHTRTGLGKSPTKGARGGGADAMTERERERELHNSSKKQRIDSIKTSYPL